jgi:hypothetical protein
LFDAQTYFQIIFQILGDAKKYLKFMSPAQTIWSYKTIIKNRELLLWGNPGLQVFGFARLPAPRIDPWGGLGLQRLQVEGHHIQWYQLELMDDGGWGMVGEKKGHWQS